MRKIPRRPRGARQARAAFRARPLGGGWSLRSSRSPTSGQPPARQIPGVAQLSSHATPLPASSARFSQLRLSPIVCIRNSVVLNRQRAIYQNICVYRFLPPRVFIRSLGQHTRLHETRPSVLLPFFFLILENITKRKFNSGFFFAQSNLYLDHS